MKRLLIRRAIVIAGFGGALVAGGLVVGTAAATPPPPAYAGAAPQATGSTLDRQQVATQLRVLATDTQVLAQALRDMYASGAINERTARRLANQIVNAANLIDVGRSVVGTGQSDSQG